MNRSTLNGHAHAPPQTLPHALIAHPFPLVVEALATILEGSGYTVTRCADGAIAAGKLHDRTSDIAIVAVDAGGVDLIRERRRSGLRTILLCDDLDAGPLLAAVELGVDGVLLSTGPVASVRACLDAVAGGDQWLDPAVTKVVLDRVGRAPTPTLTKRERDVAELVAAGKRNRTIADTLGISEGTVKMHLHNVYAKLGLESRTQLAMDVRARAA